MSALEPAVAILNLLYNQWSITTPGKDSKTAATQDPTKVHFTNRHFAPVPLRYHPHHISILPINKPYRALQIGSITKYSNFENLAVHVWVLPSPQLSIEAAYTDMGNMQTEIRRIIRILGETAGSNIQHTLLGPWQDRSELDRDVPRLHVEARAVPILFEMSTS